MLVLAVDCKPDMTLSALEAEIVARLWCELALDSHRLKLILPDGTLIHQPAASNSVAVRLGDTSITSKRFKVSDSLL